MNQSKFKIKAGDYIVFLDKTDSSFEQNGKYKILIVTDIGIYPWNEPHHFDIKNKINHLNPKIITIKDKNNTTFYLIYTDIGFYLEDEKNTNFNIFAVERKLRKDKLEKLDGR